MTEADVMQTFKLTTEAWLIEEEARTVKTLEHMRTVWGTMKAESHSTYAYFEGYLSAIRTVIGKMDLLKVLFHKFH